MNGVQKYMRAAVQRPKDMALHAAKLVAREKFAWPGGYEMFLVMEDGQVLCAACVKKEFKLIAAAHRAGLRDGWKPSHATNMSECDEPETCAHCGAKIGGDE